MLEGGAAERLWQAFRDAPARATDDITLRVGSRPHDLPELLARLPLDDLGLLGRSCHAGTGIARLRLRRPGRSCPAGQLAQRIAACHAQARAQQGYVVVESAPLGIAGREALPWGTASLALGQKLKEAWDPMSILNPGRMAI